MIHVISYGITVKTRFGTKPHFLDFIIIFDRDDLDYPDRDDRWLRGDLFHR